MFNLKLKHILFHENNVESKIETNLSKNNFESKVETNLSENNILNLKLYNSSLVKIKLNIT